MCGFCLVQCEGTYWEVTSMASTRPIISTSELVSQNRCVMHISDNFSIEVHTLGIIIKQQETSGPGTLHFASITKHKLSNSIAYYLNFNLWLFLTVTYGFQDIRSAVHAMACLATHRCDNNIKVVYWSAMARSAIESDFRSSKMIGLRPFCEKIANKSKWRIDLKWWEMWSNVMFGHTKWPSAAIL